MRFATTSISMLLCMIASDSWSGLVQTSEPVELSESERSAVEKTACANTPGKTAIEVQGHRSNWRGHERGATVECDDGIEAEAYQADFERLCRKKLWHWVCEPPQIRLRIDVAGRGPYQIRVEELSLEEAVHGMQCLEAALKLNPQVLDGGKAERVPVISRHTAEDKDAFRVYLEAHGECYWLVYPRQCTAEGPQVMQISVESGCISE